MYKKIDVLINHALYLPTMPLILCEYAHAMGNSVGNLIRLLGHHREVPFSTRRSHLGLGGPGSLQQDRRR